MSQTYGTYRTVSRICFGRGFGTLGRNPLICVVLSVFVSLSPLMARGQSAAAQPQATDSAAKPSPLQIGPGDLLQVTVFNTPELSAQLRVDSFGRITLPVGGQIDVGGLSDREAASAIEQRLRSAQVMINPLVSISFVEYGTQGVTVLGEVKKPGTYTLLGPHSLYDALAAAGGLTEFEGSSIKIGHAHDGGSPQTIPVHGPDFSELQKSTIVNPGDTIVVSKAPEIYVIGDVERAGAFSMPYGQRLTVLDAIGLAYGATKTAAMSRAAVIRKQGDGAQTIRFDLDKVMKNTEPDPVLEAGDIVVIPRSGGKTFAYTFLPAITGASINAAFNALIYR